MAIEKKDNKTNVPMEHYIAAFAAKDPQEMAAKSGVPFDGKAFATVLMGREIQMHYPSMEAVYTDTGAAVSSAVRILFARLLLEGTIAESTGRMLAYSETPWGNVYEAQFKGRCISRLAFGFGNALDKFEAACQTIAGVPVKGGDKAFDIPFLPQLTVRLLVWEGDEEFPPSAQILFSDNFPNAYTAEDLAVIGDVILNAMKGRW